MAESTPDPSSGYQRRWRAHNSQRRTEILRAAAELVEQAPPGAPISMQQIANLAGVAKSVVYRQFSGKDDLARSLRGHIVDRFAAELESDLDISSGSLREILGRAIGSAATWMQDNPALVDLLRSGPTDRAPASPDAMSELTQRIVARARETIDAITGAAGAAPGSFGDIPFVLFTTVESTLTGWVRGEPSLRGHSRTQIVASLTDITWFILDGAARTLGLVVDPDQELTEAAAGLAIGHPAAP